METKVTEKVLEPVPVFEKSEVIENAGLFDTTPEIMAGALSLVHKENVTKAEATDALKAYLVRPVGKE
ncbi:MAG: hypothetical protein RSE04_06010 [Hydrogenoanaerobacterium sp.]